jgi:hypothetical protein
VALKLLLVDLEVGECGVHSDAPVDEPVRAVDRAGGVQVAEGRADGFGEGLQEEEGDYFEKNRPGEKGGRTYVVHGKRDAVPVIAAAEAVQLVGDAALVAVSRQDERQCEYSGVWSGFNEDVKVKKTVRRRGRG